MSAYGAADSIRLCVQGLDLRNNWRWPYRSLGPEPLSQVRGLGNGRSRTEPSYFRAKQEQVKRDEGAWWSWPGQAGKRAGGREMGKASHPCILTLCSTNKMSSLDLCAPSYQGTGWHTQREKFALGQVFFQQSPEKGWRPDQWGRGQNYSIRELYRQTQNGLIPKSCFPATLEHLLALMYSAQGCFFILNQWTNKTWDFPFPDQ